MRTAASKGSVFTALVVASTPWFSGCAGSRPPRVDVERLVSHGSSVDSPLPAAIAGLQEDSSNAPAHHGEPAPEAARADVSLASLIAQTEPPAEPEPIPAGQSRPEIPGVTDRDEQPITLASALAVTAGQNPQVNFARQRIAEAFADAQAAEVLWLPSLRAGANYNKHEGRIQDVAGEMIETSRTSIYGGMGALAVGAGSPNVHGLLMDFHLRDAVFMPRIADQRLGARQSETRAVTNDLMLDTALAYIDLLEAMQLRAVAEQILVEADLLAETTAAFAETGQGLPADADRSRAEAATRQVDIRRADEGVRRASIRLARLIRADQSRTLVPIEPVLIPIDLVDVDQPLPHLLSTGLVNRPELAEARYLVGEAVERYRRERYAPLVPSVLLGMSYGGNGGGLGSTIENFGDRMDFDIAAFWEVRNLGWGEQAARNSANARVQQARWRQLQQMDQVAADVAEAQAEVSARREQLDTAREAIAAAEDSYRRNSERIREGEGLPIEVLQSIQALDESLRRYTMVVADYNRAQFRLQRALGWPVEAGAATEP